jgi:hypothetical protein
LGGGGWDIWRAKQSNQTPVKFDALFLTKQFNIWGGKSEEYFCFMRWNIGMGRRIGWRMGSHFVKVICHGKTIAWETKSAKIAQKKRFECELLYAIMEWKKGIWNGAKSELIGRKIMNGLQNFRSIFTLIILENSHRKGKPQILVAKGHPQIFLMFASQKNEWNGCVGGPGFLFKVL